MACIVLAACSAQTRHAVLSTLFDGVPPPGESAPASTRVPRVTPPPEPDGPEPVIAAAPAPVRPRATRWSSYAAAAAEIPKDMMGNLDWVKAANEAVIDPSPAIDPDAAPSGVLEYDVRLDPGIPNFEVVFPHAEHTYWLTCNSCHPAIFQMRAGANPITMGKIFEGEYCGRCHGKVAFPPQTGCPRCHVKMAG